MKKYISILFLFASLLSYSQTTPTIKQVLNAGNVGSGTKQIRSILGATAINDVLTHPPTSVAVVTASDEIIILQGGVWKRTSLSSATGSAGWLLLGNAGTVDGTNFVGTTDNVPLNFRVNNLTAGRVNNNTGADPGSTFFGYRSGQSNANTNNTGIGWFALNANTSGTSNTAMGSTALRFNSTGISNTAIGQGALEDMTGSQGVAVGASALTNNTTGDGNTAVGYASLLTNTNANYNTAVGWQTLNLNNGSSNTAIGYKVLSVNTVGANTGVGFQALMLNTTGTELVAIGAAALSANTIGNRNIGIGNSVLQNNIIGNQNIGIGASALSVSTADANTGIGYNSLLNTTTGGYNTAIGNISGTSNTTGASNVFVGYNAQPSANNLTNAVSIGANSTVTANNTMMLGDVNMSVGIGATAATARLTLPGGTTAAGTAPLKLSAGNNLTAPEKGAIELSAFAFFGTPNSGSGQGVIPTVYSSTAAADFTGTNVATAQPVFTAAQDAINVQSNTTYYFEAIYKIARSAGITSHTIGTLFGGTATYTNIDYKAESTASIGNVITPISTVWIKVATNTAVIAAFTGTTEDNIIHLRGYIRTNAGGTIIPQVQYSAAPGGVPTFERGTFFRLYPIGPDTVTINGAWN